MKKQLKFPLEQAVNEVLAFLEEHDIDTDVDSFQEEDAKEFNEIVEAIAKPVAQGRAIIDGDQYTITLKRPQGDLTQVTIKGMSAADMFAADKAKKGNEMAKTGHMIASMLGLPYAQVCKFDAKDFMLLSRISGLFMAV